MERLKTMAILALLAALAGSIALAATSGEAEVRINARQLEDGRVEFGLEQEGERKLPRSRYFPANVSHDRWLRSSPITVTTEPSSSFGSTRTIRSTNSNKRHTFDSGWYRIKAQAMNTDSSSRSLFGGCEVTLRALSSEYSLSDVDLTGWLTDTDDSGVIYRRFGHSLYEAGDYQVVDNGPDNCVSWRVEITRVE